jgi:hypothetical protein
MICKQCGGDVPNGETCADRFNVLLALDHSRQAPWGPRHGPAFAVFALQHADDYTDENLSAAWTMLNRVYAAGDSIADVVHGLRRMQGKQAAWGGASLPPRERAPHNFAVTIVDLGNFDAENYANKLDAMCRATIEAWKSVM